MTSIARDLAAVAGWSCFTIAGFTIALQLGLVIAGVGLIAAAIIAAPLRPTGGNDGSD